MKTIQMTIDEPLLREVDQVIQTMETNRSAFIREALKLSLQRYKTRKMEEQHAQGYAQYPVEKGEFDIWYDEQDWGTP